MNKLYKFLSAALLSTTLLSCVDQLDKSPLDSFDNATFWSSEGNAQLALTGVYRGGIIQNGTTVNPSNWWAYDGLLFLEFASDNAYDRRGDNSAFHRLSNGTLTPSINILGSYWSSSYKNIANANFFLENIDKVTMDESRKARMKSEVRFLRAAQYFYMSQFWGSVPLVLRTLSPEEANVVTKASKEEIVSFLLSEFDEIVDFLPSHKSLPNTERGRVTKQTVLAFKGRLLLSEKKWADAESTYAEIIAMGENIIDPDYAGLFLKSNENSNEIIFSTQYIDNLGANGMLQHFFPALAGGWHIFNPLGSLVESYDFTDGSAFSYDSPLYDPKDLGKNRDPRLKATILYNGSTFKGTYITHPDSASSPDQLGAGKQTTQSGFGLKKFVDETFSGNLTNYGGNTPVIRYAEVLLSYLEAKLEAGKPISQADLDATINLVRGRASVGMPPITTTSSTELRQILRKERRVEMACEGTRYWDILRWGIAKDVLNADFYGASFPGAVKKRLKNGQPDPYSRWYVTSRKFREGTDNYWPVPQSEVNINPGLQ
ncbi:RagB/SusD family nutrient uptake outer membrane protein [Algoriphagus sp. H41]|uniref:RagB/SusD family nutrient uptake outer membrane protein n=1 Tax=Algoriphagus oliviformis TaxID=2811231 RepID=A0ABS3BZ54_9BACT|nr:RagB/SusD family nutrient uptake outer membrane protein [Algoriphagus oliviformis]MBN7809958.1 RagB/SusD family nutrient uptake outer membrane protein [Algoriphagus oliviformis]